MEKREKKGPARIECLNQLLFLVKSFFRIYFDIGDYYRRFFHLDKAFRRCKLAKSVIRAGGHMCLFDATVTNKSKRLLPGKNL